MTPSAWENSRRRVFVVTRSRAVEIGCARRRTADQMVECGDQVVAPEVAGVIAGRLGQHGFLADRTARRERRVDPRPAVRRVARAISRVVAENVDHRAQVGIVSAGRGQRERAVDGQAEVGEEGERLVIAVRGQAGARGSVRAARPGRGRQVVDGPGQVGPRRDRRRTSRGCAGARGRVGLIVLVGLGSIVLVGLGSIVLVGLIVVGLVAVGLVGVVVCGTVADDPGADARAIVAVRVGEAEARDQVRPTTDTPSSATVDSAVNPRRTVRAGMDLHLGASCVYPAHPHPEWRPIARQRHENPRPLRD